MSPGEPDRTSVFSGSSKIQDQGEKNKCKPPNALPPMPGLSIAAGFEILVLGVAKFQCNSHIIEFGRVITWINLEHETPLILLQIFHRQNY